MKRYNNYNNNNDFPDRTNTPISKQMFDDPRFKNLLLEPKVKRNYTKFKIVTPRELKYPKSPKKNMKPTKMMCYIITRTAIGPKPISWKGRFHYRYRPSSKTSLKDYPNIPLSIKMDFKTSSGILVTRKFHLPIWNKIKDNFDDWCAYSTYNLPLGIQFNGVSYNKLVNVIDSYGNLREMRLYA